jgi:hypothetical protein
MAHKSMLTAAFRIAAAAAIALVLIASHGYAQPLAFDLYQRTGQTPGNTVLVVGGIQGDEPGGFNAAALLLTHYDITRGSVWVVPNLNFTSIIKRSRGVYGDLNRKFRHLSRSDPEYSTIQRIKKIITADDVDLVLNLHDGSGFYRERYIDNMRNPNRWGQSVIIDRRYMGPGEMNDLHRGASTVAAQVNRQLIDAEHIFAVKNTQTHLGNAEMAKTLTYFAVQNGKPAYGLETSKSFPTHLRAYYHLCMVEAFLEMSGIQFKREIPLAPESVRAAIDNNVRLSFHDRRVVLAAANARRHLRFFPLRKGTPWISSPAIPCSPLLPTTISCPFIMGIGTLPASRPPITITTPL